MRTADGMLRSADAARSIARRPGRSRRRPCGRSGRRSRRRGCRESRRRPPGRAGRPPRASSSITVMPVSWSSAAVGSSQTSSRGSCTRARAIATRCIWPPESWLGRLSQLLAHADRRQDLAGLADGPLSVQPAITSGIAAFSAAVSAGKRLYCWNTKPMFLARTWSARGRSSSSISLAEDLDRPPVAVENAGDDRQQRRLAAARRADDQRHLAGVDVPVDAAQRLDPLLAAAEMLGQPADPHRDRRRRPPVDCARSSTVDRLRSPICMTIASIPCQERNRPTTPSSDRSMLNGRRSPARAGSPAGR